LGHSKREKKEKGRREEEWGKGAERYEGKTIRTKKKGGCSRTEEKGNHY